MLPYVLQLFLLVVLCTPASIVQLPLYQMNLRQVQNIYKDVFCYRCADDQCDPQVAYLSSLPEAGNFNLSASPIKNNKYNISSVNVYRAESNQTYRFPSGKLLSKNHSSLLYLPGEGAAIRGIVTYFHTNTLGKWNGPSSNSREYQALAGFYASQGYAVLMPDLLGYRHDTDPRPFLLYPEVAVRSAVTTLNELVPFFKGFANVMPNLFSLGYGEGGSYALWFSKCISTPDQCPAYTLANLPEHTISLNSFYRFKGTAAMEGALDLSRTMYDFLTKNVGLITRNNDFMILDQLTHNLAKGHLAVSLLDGYLRFSLDKQNQLEAYIARDFFNMNCSDKINQPNLCNIKDTRMSLTEAVNSTASEAIISLAFGLSSFSQLNAGERNPFLGAYLPDYIAGENNTVLTLVSRSLFTNQSFYSALMGATIIDYAQQASTPTYVWTLVSDSVISSNNTRNFYKTGRGNKFVSSYEFENSKYQPCNLAAKKEPVDHVRGEILANIFALNFIEKNK